jgi:hypothetical protein
VKFEASIEMYNRLLQEGAIFINRYVLQNDIALRYLLGYRLGGARAAYVTDLFRTLIDLPGSGEPLAVRQPAKYTGTICTEDGITDLNLLPHYRELSPYIATVILTQIGYPVRDFDFTEDPQEIYAFAFTNDPKPSTAAMPSVAGQAVNLAVLAMLANKFKGGYNFMFPPLNSDEPLKGPDKTLFLTKYKFGTNTVQLRGRNAQQFLNIQVQDGSLPARNVRVTLPDPAWRNLFESGMGLLPMFGVMSGGSVGNLFDEKHGAVFRGMVEGASGIMRANGKDFSDNTQNKLMQVGAVADDQFAKRTELMNGIRDSVNKNQDVEQLREKLNEIEGGLARTYIRMADIGRTIDEIVKET